MSNLDQNDPRMVSALYADSGHYTDKERPQRSSVRAWMIGGLVAIGAIAAVAVVIVNTNNQVASRATWTQAAPYQQDVAQTQASDVQASASAAQQKAAEARNSSAIAEARATQSAPPLSPATVPAQGQGSVDAEPSLANTQ